MDSERERKAIRLIEQIMDATKNGDSERPVDLTNKLESQFSDTVNFMVNGPSCLIETGDIANNKRLVQRGTQLGISALERLPNDSEYRGMTHYNIGNGYYCEFKIDLRLHKDMNLYEYEPLQNAKRHLRKAIQEKGTNADIRKQALVNLANVYDSVGRTVESIHLYEQVLRNHSSFAMARANLGQALCSFANICGQYRGATLVQAYKLIERALDDHRQLREIGGELTVQHFMRQLDEIQARFRDKSALHDIAEHPVLNTRRLSQFERTYLKFCFDHKLFLNFHIHMTETLCSASVVDNITISLLEDPRKQSRFFYLTKYINQIKEDYATARYLVFQSTYRRPYLNRISRLTKYVDTLDYTDNNLYMGMIKAAFNRAYSILDKIGVFLDKYLHLETRKRIYFTTVWAYKRDGVWVVRDNIVQHKSPSLLGLYDINRDFRTLEYKDIIDIRNASTHERLSVVGMGFLPPDGSGNDDMKVTADRLLNRTIELLLITKSAICNLVDFVNSEENRNRPDEGLVAPMFYFDQDQDL